MCVSECVEAAGRKGSGEAEHRTGSCAVLKAADVSRLLSLFLSPCLSCRLADHRLALGYSPEEGRLRGAKAFIIF